MLFWSIRQGGYGGKRQGEGVTVFDRHGDNSNRNKHLPNYLRMREGLHGGNTPFEFISPNWDCHVQDGIGFQFPE